MKPSVSPSSKPSLKPSSSPSVKPSVSFSPSFRVASLLTVSFTQYIYLPPARNFLTSEQKTVFCNEKSKEAQSGASEYKFVVLCFVSSDEVVSADEAGHTSRRLQQSLLTITFILKFRSNYHENLAPIRDAFVTEANQQTSLDSTCAALNDVGVSCVGVLPIIA